MHVQEFSGEDLEGVARGMPVIMQTRPDYRGRLALHGLGQAVTLSRTNSGGTLRTTRTPRLAARTSGGHLLRFCVYVAGRGHVHQHDRFAELASGTGVLYEGARPWELFSSDESQCMNLQFSRELLPLRTTEITEACARSVDPAGPAMQMLTGYLGRLFDVADELTAGQRLDAGRAAIELLAMVLRDVTPAVPSGDGPDEVLLEMMRMYAREHLSDPSLRVEELARRHHVSVRYAYSLFARIGTTPGAYLRQERLLAARVMLSDPRCAWLGTSDIAAAVGFVNLRTFERAFQRQYGMTPAGWRCEHCCPGSAPAGLEREMFPR
ncbi:AraC family transcriptional regulator [Pseudonocardia alaniniphila]|uniref:AraC family transcriptional regulator n=1 Tax=Pseudonocardia alaniniphila TaxID=75291 RepID=A0ABS9TNY5_9PSEU|nr:AraC family transcriptional regulator [Pseudonocardia alaniniphila]MCH6170252.1 AraC family transcriptional regulator [Pseudonocardia alaniniphila]